MTSFRYTAIDSAGERRSGECAAQNRQGALQKLRSQQLRILRLETVAEGNEAKTSTSSKVAANRRASKKITASALIRFFQMFRRLHHGGISVAESVRTMARSSGSAEIGSIAQKIWGELSDGHSLATAFRRSEIPLPSGITEVIEAGEATGRLGPILEEIVSFLEERKRFVDTMRAKSAYPLFLVGVALAVAAFLVLVLVPKVEGMLASLGSEMNVLTKVLLGFSEFAFVGFPILAVLVVVLISAIFWIRREEAGRLSLDRISLRIPIIGPLIMTAGRYRLSNLLGTLLSNGVDMTESLRLVERSIPNLEIRRRFALVRQNVNNGARLSQQLRQEQLFDPLATDILAVNEAIGEVASGLISLRDDDRLLLENKLNRMTKILSGAALAFAFALVALVSLGLISSIFQVSRSISGG